ncbi:MAG: carboxylating nicotinate-nucleotide diphosphorylase [Gammaproteobacteria bacterium]|nr:carboxylating nicotinate-nucleotide diphosphorylase [Gammaproteobacteria bacterium]
MNIPQSYIENSVANALLEDIGTGDVTGQLIPEDEVSMATIISRDTATICGIDWVEEVFSQLDHEIHIEWEVEDGEIAEPGQTLCTLSGNARALLSGERTALNFLQTLSATATVARRYASEVKGTQTQVLDTRKTIPGLRLAQKYAVSCGGCSNHRIGLFDAILIKENHIAAAGSIAAAVDEARFINPELSIEVEVENMHELQQALDAKANRIMLDNFDPEQIKQAIELTAKRAELEASGGITLENIREYAETGVDYISIGALTKDIQSIDLSMRFGLL